MLDLHSFRPGLGYEGGVGLALVPVDEDVALFQHAVRHVGLDRSAVCVVGQLLFLQSFLRAGPALNHLSPYHGEPTALADVLNGAGCARIGLQQFLDGVVPHERAGGGDFVVQPEVLLLVYLQFLQRDTQLGCDGIAPGQTYVEGDLFGSSLDLSFAHHFGAHHEFLGSVLYR